MDGEICTVCGKDVVLTLDEAYAIGMACTAVNAAGIQDKTYYYITITLDDQVNPNGFGRGTLVANEKYISVAGGYLIPEGQLVKGDTVVLCGQLGKVTSAKASAGENKGFEARLFNVALVADLGLTAEEAFDLGMTYDKSKYSDEYYYVTVTLDNQVNLNGFGRMTLASDETYADKYLTVAGGYLTDDAQGSVTLGDTVLLRAKVGAVNSAMTTGGKECRLYEVTLVKILNDVDSPKPTK